MRFSRQFSSDFGFFIRHPFGNISHSISSIFLIDGQLVDELDSGVKVLVEVVGHSEILDFRAVVLLPLSELLVEALDVLNKDLVLFDGP